jgi:hypothetical protein
MTIQRYASIDESGNCLAFYADDIWPIDKIPGTAIKISDDLWQAWLSDRDQRLVNGVLVAIPPQAPTQADYTAAIQSRVDAVAQAKNYDNGVSLASYKDSTNADWAAEATSFIAWRDDVWGYANAQLALVLSGQRTQPTVDALVGELPAPPWPAQEQS